MTSHDFDISRLHGHKHEHEIRALHSRQVCVVFGGERVDMVFNGFGVGIQRTRALGIRLGCDSTLVVNQ